MAEGLNLAGQGDLLTEDAGAEFDAIVAREFPNDQSLSRLGGLGLGELRPFTPGQVVTEESRVVWASVNGANEGDTDGSGGGHSQL